ncbi:M20 family metallopeptidase [Pseudarthrobacter sp. C4D7]|uniref:M20 family metallopeptidase n=1 Tax=Pseudarthrobacter sp. C4D7 TaxID=2735268 RepID=UPI001584FB8A|nr:M20 family metallopeptidase [Pseudarthrobacter sp. C4D7]NUT72424.1 M20 family metallopeptidase [Pseudarthrobacter sp. C4D7]
MDTTDMTPAAGDLRAALADGVERWKQQVEALAKDIHGFKELSFEEVKSAEAITALLAEGGFEVEHGSAGLPTAFTATAGSGELTVALCVEYDALPGIGHACGHNLIAGASVAAALALQPYVDQLGITLKAIGTPAEEHGGGKVLMLEQGAFDGVGLALMVHPVQDGVTYNPAGTSAQAVGRYKATFTGKAAHAAAAPHLGVNAADAAVLSQVAIGLLRQQIPSDHRIACFVAEAGHVTNIIPEKAVVEFEARAFTLPEFEALLVRVRRCFEGAALATGTTLAFEDTEPLYEPLIQDDDLAAHWTSAMDAFGKDTSPAAGLSGGSTDMGNISQVIPSLHPWLSIPGADVPIHSHAFAALADTPQAYGVMFEAGTALAWTVAAAASTPTQRQRFTQAAYRRRTSPQEAVTQEGAS